MAALGAAEALAAHHDAMAAHLVSTEGRLGAVLGVLDRVAAYAATAVQLQAYVVACVRGGCGVAASAHPRHISPFLLPLPPLRHLLVLHVGVFYGAAAVAVWALTSAERTAGASGAADGSLASPCVISLPPFLLLGPGARLPLYTGLIACALAEAYIATHWGELAAVVADAEAAAEALGAPTATPALWGSAAHDASDALPSAPSSAWTRAAVLASPLVGWVWAAARMAWGRTVLACRAALMPALLWLAPGGGRGAAAAASRHPPHAFDVPLPLAFGDSLHGAQAGLRWAFLAWAAALLLRHAAAFVEYGRAGFEAVVALRARVDALALAAAGAPPPRHPPACLRDAEGAPSTSCAAPSFGPLSQQQQQSSAAAAAAAAPPVLVYGLLDDAGGTAAHGSSSTLWGAAPAAASGGGSEWDAGGGGFDGGSSDGDWEPQDDAWEVGAGAVETGAAATAAYAAGVWPGFGVRSPSASPPRPPLRALSSAGSAAPPPHSFGHHPLAFPAGSPPLTHAPVSWLLSSSQPLLLLSAAPSHRYSMRPRPDVPPPPNPVLAVESPGAFAQLVGLRRVASLLQLQAQAAAAAPLPSTSSSGGSPEWAGPWESSSEEEEGGSDASSCSSSGSSSSSEQDSTLCGAGRRGPHRGVSAPIWGAHSPTNSAGADSPSKAECSGDLRSLTPPPPPIDETLLPLPSAAQPGVTGAYSPSPPAVPPPPSAQLAGLRRLRDSEVPPSDVTDEAGHATPAVEEDAQPAALLSTRRPLKRPRLSEAAPPASARRRSERLK